MNIHQNARLTPLGRAAMISRIEVEGWSVARAAEAFGISRQTVGKWLQRHRRGGERRLHDRSSAPRRCPRRTSAEIVDQVQTLRRQRMTGPAIARNLSLARSTVGLILRRLGLGKLSALEPRPPIVRYERAAPGEMIHLDIKKLGRFTVEGHRVTGDRRAGRSKKAGWDFLHVCVDDASRLAYTEILPSEGQHDTTAFLERALAWLSRHGVAVQRVMTDNGSAYRSKLFAQALRIAGARHVRTKPYTPRTNGKAERFIQTSLREWAYGRPYACSEERSNAIKPWTDAYNLTRPHSGIGGLTPWQRVNNLLGNDT
ncbi:MULTISPECIES: IS481 family transposase [unclassified Caulobacter]|uniref:IS481 family transposase n=1 Tax=unclassified Caulobacter TaxID=2648921 RepID=UPI000786586B|nr:MULTISPECIES: IS481 family transposase [unclassified Caulobacter]AZS19907.1 IS481 family transposase [Caulobacter sp. FWC26]AZS20378.1 IS481 family transposase [Caulobacter sp. FWC26]AZS22966.1 IS481 family transposase [Caulobacter sp. FWC26]